MTYPNPPLPIPTRPSPAFVSAPALRSNPAPTEQPRANSAGRDGMHERMMDSHVKTVPQPQHQTAKPDAALKQARTPKPNSHKASIAVELNVREAAIMLDRDIPKTIMLIETKTDIYAKGYIAECRDLLSLLRSPMTVTLLKALKNSDIKTLPLKQQLPKLAVTRTATLLSAISKALEAKRPLTKAYAADEHSGESAHELQFRIHDTLAQIMTKHLPAQADYGVESLLPAGPEPQTRASRAV